jgi:hypothetical protein
LLGTSQAFSESFQQINVGEDTGKVENSQNFQNSSEKKLNDEPNFQSQISIKTGSKTSVKTVVVDKNGQQTTTVFVYDPKNPMTPEHNKNEKIP